MLLKKLLEIISKILSNSDARLNAVQAQNEALTAENEELRTKLSEQDASLADAIATYEQRLPAVELPEEVANDPANPSQNVDEFIEAIGAEPDVPVDAESIPEVGDATPTPEAAVESVMAAVEEAVAA